MQDRYAGDVGDFGKLGLLRQLTAGTPPLRLGVLWYRVQDESHNNDGRHTSYLTSDAKQHADLRACDPALATALARLIASGQRSIADLERAANLPPGTRFHSTPLGLAGTAVADRPRTREAWFTTALTAVQDTDIVFLDPDNGLEARSATQGQAKIVKYARYADLEALRAAGHSLVVYHHLGRTGGTHPEQVTTLRDTLAQRLGLPHLPAALTFRKGSARTFFIIPAPAHEHLLGQRLEALAESPWAAVFERAPDPSDERPQPHSEPHTHSEPQTHSERLWHARGQRHARTQLLRRLLIARHGPLSPAHERRVRDASDDELTLWLDRAIDGPSLEDIIAP